MNSDKLNSADLSKIIRKPVHMTDRVVMDFGQSVSPGHIKMWINHLIGQAQLRKRALIKADTILITDKGLVVGNGKNISMIGGGEVMDGLEAPIIIKGPKPKFPDSDEFVNIDGLKGRLMKVKDIVSDKLGSIGKDFKANSPGQSGVQ